ncbi:uncharacterized protein LOC113286771 [Papaver somniferum]|uniref:uncharacterized protein LOC113286771 n=1 Tax=Papaver somniferum TaxID=3469 RepID=UPI000E6F751D|nr:uncharacterized protein LOC113286771 [Papaver somniferum]
MSFYPFFAQVFRLMTRCDSKMIGCLWMNNWVQQSLRRLFEKRRRIPVLWFLRVVGFTEIIQFGCESHYEMRCSNEMLRCLFYSCPNSFKYVTGVIFVVDALERDLKMQYQSL